MGHAEEEGSSPGLLLDEEVELLENPLKQGADARVVRHEEAADSGSAGWQVGGSTRQSDLHGYLGEHKHVEDGEET